MEAFLELASVGMDKTSRLCSLDELVYGDVVLVAVIKLCFDRFEVGMFALKLLKLKVFAKFIDNTAIAEVLGSLLDEREI